MKQSTIPFPLASLMLRLRVASYRSWNNKVLSCRCCKDDDTDSDSHSIVQDFDLINTLLPKHVVHNPHDFVN